MRRVALNSSGYADVRITTDASPEGLGGLLVVNKRIVATFFSVVEQSQTDELLLDFKESSSQSALEAWPYW